MSVPAVLSRQYETRGIAYYSEKINSKFPCNNSKGLNLMLSRNIRFLSLLTRMPFTTTATEIDYEKIQKDLNSMGYNVSFADGIPGRNNNKCIKKFSTMQGMSHHRKLLKMNKIPFET